MPDQPPLRVIVADDHPVFREGLAHAINDNDDLHVVAEVGDGDQALKLIEELEPDVAVLDLRMDGLPTPQIIAASSDLPTRVLVLSAVTERAAVTGVLEAGAAGYIAKQASREAICNAIRRVAAGESVLGHEVQSVLVEEIRSARSILTEREQQCLEFLAEGLSSIQIAEQLILGPSTVKSHLRTLYEKLGVSDRGAAVAEGMRRGLVR